VFPIEDTNPMPPRTGTSAIESKNCGIERQRSRPSDWHHLTATPNQQIDAPAAR
jgi:hypothetical protein